jgi:hypothetical protein
VSGWGSKRERAYKGEHPFLPQVFHWNFAREKDGSACFSPTSLLCARFPTRVARHDMDEKYPHRKRSALLSFFPFDRGWSLQKTYKRPYLGQRFVNHTSTMKSSTIVSTTIPVLLFSGAASAKNEDSLSGSTVGSRYTPGNMPATAAGKDTASSCSNSVTFNFNAASGLNYYKSPSMCRETDVSVTYSMPQGTQLPLYFHLPGQKEETMVRRHPHVPHHYLHTPQSPM